MKIIISVPLLLMISANTFTYAAQDSTSVMIDAAPCLSLTRAIDRLQCFEDQVQASNPQQSAAESAAETALVRESITPAPAAMPGNTEILPAVAIPRNTGSVNNSPAPVPANVEERVEERAEQQNAAQPVQATAEVASIEDNFGLPESSGVRENEDGENEMFSVVAEIKELNPNRKLITLENGQVWQQSRTKKFVLDENDEVRIYPQPWGSSYRLSTPKHKGFILVERRR